jgi:hypothetical protein
MERLPVTSATATAGTVEKISGNDTGVRLIGNARSAGSFSATVQLLTSQLDVAGACAYASNYPPVGEYTEANKIKFTGTPPYDLVLTSAESGTYTYSINDSYYHLHEGETLQSFTDKTGAPGRIQSIYAYPPTAASAATWSYGNRTWSDVVNSPPSACTQGYSPSTTTNPLYVVNNNLHYFNWFCVNTAASQLCPYPWRVANYDDFVSLIQSTTGSSLKQAWPERGFVRDTYYEQSSILYGYTNAAGDACAYQIDSGTFHTSRCHPSLYYALPVRCVR